MYPKNKKGNKLKLFYTLETSPGAPIKCNHKISNYAQAIFTCYLLNAIDLHCDFKVD